MRKTSFFSVALPQSHDSHWIDPNLQKGRGEDARDMYSTSTADEYHEDEYPTGEMTEPRHIGHRQGVNWNSDHLGIFGEKRHVFVSATKRPNATKINWLHIKPGTKVEPHHVTQIFEGLHNAGYTKPMEWAALRDDDEQHRASGTSRRDRLFRPLMDQWDKFVAAKQGEPTVQKSGEDARSVYLINDMREARTMRKSFFDFGFFIDGALMKAPTESGLDPEQHAALTARFPRAAPPPPPAKPETPEIREETHSGMTPERIAQLTSAQRSLMTETLHKYREARPRQGPDEEGTPMRSAGVAMPSGVVQPMIIHKDEEGGVDAIGRTRMRQKVNKNLVEESNNQAMNRIHTREHVLDGTLTDGNEFMNLAGFAAHRANQIAAEYAKWHESGGGPRPDLSKYENPVIRRKDGSEWDYRDAFKRMVDLDSRASRHDTQHGWMADTFGDSFAIDDPDHVHSIHPTRIWDRIHGMMQPKTEEAFDYDDPSTGRNVRVKRPALTTSDLKRGLPPSQQIPIVRELLKLGLRHQKMSRTHANQSESPVRKSGEGRLSRLQWGHSIADVKTPNGLVEQKFEQPEGYPPLHGLGHRGHFGPGGMMKMNVLPADVDGNWHKATYPPPSPDAIKHPYVQQFMLAHDAPRDPHTGDVLEMFHALWDAGYHGSSMHYYPDDNRKGTGENLRRRLFRPYRAAWAHFAADKREGKPIDGLYGLPPVPKSTLQPESTVQKSAAWQRKEGKNPKGGLNAKGRESAKREGHNLKPPVKSGDNPRRASFLARMGGSPGPEYDEHGEPTRLLLALRVWGASSKADAKKKAAAMSERLKKKKLAKGRGEDAKLAHLSSRYAASGLSERDFPTGQMMGITRSGIRHLGVFGEKRHIRVEASERERGDTTHIDWLHVMPGTKVEPHHVTQIFEALHAAGYEKPLRWNAMREDDEKYSLRPARRDRLFGPFAAQWDKFVASKQAGSKPPKES